ncbi:uncharacterized protein LOC125383202 [Haliotis rufescens]|uniref:uncharacterized protein LOC125383202 n=1 Tax=Haliotis rufescens TaxID=6454 RepID=UPI00201F4E8D|nr:uncharacterized protein LOC125383202 [Haliotis rufescens]
MSGRGKPMRKRPTRGTRAATKKKRKEQAPSQSSPPGMPEAAMGQPDNLATARGPSQVQAGRSAPFQTSSGENASGSRPTGGEFVDISFNPEVTNNITELVSLPTQPLSTQTQSVTSHAQSPCFPPILFAGSEFTPPTTQCGDDDLGANVPSSIKQKICNGEYINLALLLKSDRELQDYACTSAIFLNSEGHLELKPKASGKVIETITDWATAFTVYISIFIKSHPEQIQGMLKYMNTIRLGASRHTGIGWRTYDEQFRLRQARNPQNSWGSINVELWMLYMQVPSQNFSSFPRNDSQSFHVQNTNTNSTCHDYNYRYCSRDKCKFKHTCSKCGGNSHPASYCLSKTQSGKFVNTSQDPNQNPSASASAS